MTSGIFHIRDDNHLVEMVEKNTTLRSCSKTCLPSTPAFSLAIKYPVRCHGAGC